MSKADVPNVAAWFQGGFHLFLRSFLKRHFHAIAIDKETRPDGRLDQHPELPLIVYANHPSWWDPLIAHYLNSVLFPNRQFYAPIDAQALEQYRVFGKLGFYGIQLDSNSGAACFLKQSLAILHHGGTAVWITPEGRFADVRDHSAPLMPGLAHLCTKLKQGWVLPLALEYPFWEERLPECLVKTAEPINVAEHQDFKKPEWAELLSARLRQAQSDLFQKAMQRSAEPFDNLLRGSRGGGIVYDSLRRVKSLATGRRFRAAHGEHFE